MASCIAACTMARSRIDVGPGRTGTAVCVVIAFQSATTSAWAGTAQIKHTKTITPASLLRRIIGLLSSLDPAERRRENLFYRFRCFFAQLRIERMLHKTAKGW